MAVLMTRTAVDRQLRALDAPEYMIGVFDRETNRMRNVRCAGADGVLRRLSWLRAMNASGCDIYIRPSADRHGLILVDDLEYADIERMRVDGILPAALIETSRENYQAWIKISADLDADDRRSVARVLAAEYDGDPGAANSSQYGRLAGFTNRKETHMDQYGKRPWVEIRDWCGKSIDVSAREKLMAKRPRTTQSDIRLDITRSLKCFTPPPGAHPTAAEMKRPARAAYKGATQKAVNDVHRNGFGKPDFHKIDFKVCRELVKKGYSRSEIFHAMMHESPGLHSRHRGKQAVEYANRTIDRCIER